MVTVGVKAPDFTLKDQHQKDVRLSSFKGRKVLLCFFPFAFSPVCTQEFTCFKDDLTQFAAKVQLLAISVDSHWTNKVFAEQIGLTFPLLSDFGKDVSKQYGVLRKEGFSDRAYFLIDEEGNIMNMQIMETPGKKLDNKTLLSIIH